MRSLVMLLFTLPLFAAPEVGYGRGQLHPEFSLPRVDGGRGRLSDYRGKRVVLFNFASW